MLNFHGSINGSKYELAKLKYRILVVSEVDAFNYIISFVITITEPVDSHRQTNLVKIP
jgi:hypothetical protein